MVTRRSLLGSAGATLLGPLAGGARANTATGAIDDSTPVASPAFEVQVQLDDVAARPAGTNAVSGMRMIRNGTVVGPALAGEIQSGHVRWQSDPARGSVDLQVHLVVQRQDGSMVEIRDRSVHPIDATRDQLARLASATALHVVDQQDSIAALFVGRLDASLLTSGSLRLNAFKVG